MYRIPTILVALGLLGLGAAGAAAQPCQPICVDAATTADDASDPAGFAEGLVAALLPAALALVLVTALHRRRA